MRVSGPIRYGVDMVMVQMMPSKNKQSDAFDLVFDAERNFEKTMLRAVKASAMVEGFDKFYADTRNSRITTKDAFTLVLVRVNELLPTLEIEKMIDDARRKAK